MRLLTLCLLAASLLSPVALATSATPYVIQPSPALLTSISSDWLLQRTCPTIEKAEIECGDSNNDGQCDDGPQD
ncbi:MAG TPA: hypothetical protein V6C99_08450 [Oculatellaceae cyanobacterium]|jgi:hypothetical protein